mgnify:CR=1 FL=1
MARYAPSLDRDAPERAADLQSEAGLTVVADGPVGPVGAAIDARFGMPEGHHRRDWAVGMKMVVDLPEGCPLTPGTVLHTLGYPEPEIFGFLYVYPDRAGNPVKDDLYVIGKGLSGTRQDLHKIPPGIWTNLYR